VKRAKLVCNTGPLIALSLLDLGEASVILAALENGIPNVLIDELRGRRVARRIYGLNVVGTARVLVELRQAERIDRIKPYLDKLLGHGYWFSTSVVSWALAQCNEEKG
jgi:predicted nucleic acid-binding protein